MTARKQAIDREIRRRLDFAEGKPISRKGPLISATRVPEGKKRIGIDGNRWIVKGGRWVRYHPLPLAVTTTKQNHAQAEDRSKEVITQIPRPRLPNRIRPFLLLPLLHDH